MVERNSPCMPMPNSGLPALQKIQKQNIIVMKTYIKIYSYWQIDFVGQRLVWTAASGGDSANGTVFKVNTNGTGFTNLHSFTATSDSYPIPTATELNHMPDYFYRATRCMDAWFGGSAGNARCSPSTPMARVLRTCILSRKLLLWLSQWRRSFPRGGLVLSGNTLYGTAENGGSSGVGTCSVFRSRRN